MIRDESLARYLDGAVWLADDRIAVLASDRCQGIEQIDFHGAQPVSRNAKLLHHAEGVLRFFIEIERDGQCRRLPLTWQQLRRRPATLEAIHRVDGWRISLRLAVAHNQMQVQCQGRTRERQTACAFRFVAEWNPRAMTTDVHGQRHWRDPQQTAPGTLQLRATDQIELREWLRRRGDYQGDFLIPEGWRRLIYRRSCPSGTARFEDVHDAYHDSPLKLYDADTWVSLGGGGFNIETSDAGWLRFIAPASLAGAHWQSPLFAVVFRSEAAAATPAPAPIYARQARRHNAIRRNAPDLDIDGFAAIRDFFGQVPGIAASAQITDFGLTRASQGSYYWMWAWDNMVTGLAQAHWGDLATLRRMVDFLRRHRDLDGALPMRWTRQLEPMDSRPFGALDFLFSELVLALYRETGDRQVLRANYTILHHAFRALAARCDEHGFFPSIGMYPDLPQKLGRSEASHVALEIGAWYGLCRNLEQVAVRLDDPETAQTAAALAAGVREHFAVAFWDDQTGFWCDSRDGRSGERVACFPLYSLLLLESPFGLGVLRESLPRAAEFIDAHLLGDNGLALTAAWDRFRRSEPAMSAWYPHWDWVAVQVLASQGRNAALRRWLPLLQSCFTSLGYCPEFVAVDVPAEQRWHHHGAVWNLNCAAGWYNALLRGVAGLSFDLGGITCHPAPGMPPFVLDKLHFRGGHWRVERRGDGRYLQAIDIDGERLDGTWKIPASYYTAANHTLCLHHSDELPRAPVLSEAWGAEVLAVAVAGDRSRCRIRGYGSCDLAIRAHRQPQVRLDGRELVLTWQAGTGLGYVQVRLAGEHELSLACS